MSKSEERTVFPAEGTDKNKGPGHPSMPGMLGNNRDASVAGRE